MPYLRIQTNCELDPDNQRMLLENASRCVAEILGKPERYVMVSIEDAAPMLFAGENSPTAYLELKSIGLPEQKTTALSAALCQLLAGQLDVPTNRIYIEFASAARHMWGWDSKTF